jgi:hypothetical protein
VPSAPDWLQCAAVGSSVWWLRELSKVAMRVHGMSDWESIGRSIWAVQSSAGGDAAAGRVGLGHVADHAAL